MPIWIVFTGLCLFVWIVAIVLIVRMYRLRRAESACARCMHAVIGISSAHCPECGESFERGVIQPWGKPLRARTYAGVAMILAGAVGAAASIPYATWGWVWVLKSMGMIYPVYQLTHQVDLTWPAGDFMRVEVDLLQPDDHQPVSGMVKLAVVHDDQVLASWVGEGICRMEPRRDPEGLDFDSEAAIAHLATQVDPSGTSPIVQSLHEAPDAARLAAIAQNLALPGQAVNLNLWDLDHRPTGTRINTKGAPRVVYPALWWYVPGSFLPVGIFLVGVVVGCRLLATRHSLMPFEQIAYAPEPD